MTKSMRAKLASLIIITTFLPGLTAAAPNSKTFGDYEVYYSVLNSTFIEPEIAGRYDITRAKDHALVNISVHKQLPDGGSEAQAVEISGTSSDLIYSTPLDFREVREGDAIYYLAELEFRNEEVRNFTIKISPEGHREPYTLKFTKTLYQSE